MVWIQVCHFVEFEKSNEGTWMWRYAENSKENINPISISDSISYVDLYNVVRELVNLDLNSYKMELISLNPKMTRLPVPPVKIDSDHKVQWYLSICEEHPLCVTLVKRSDEEQNINCSLEETEIITENAAIDTQHVGCSGNRLATQDMINIAEFVVDDDDNMNAYADGHLVNWDSLNVMEEGGQQQGKTGLSFATEENHENFSTRDVTTGTSICSMISLSRPSSVRIPENEDLQCKTLFPTKQDLIARLQWLAVTYHFEFKVLKASTTLYVVVCVEENCKWRMRAVKINGSEIFEVRKYVGHHTCSMSICRRDHRQATYTLIGKYISANYKDVNRIYRPNDIISDVRRKFGITISYTKAFMAKQYGYGLIRGRPDESYVKLPQYCYMLEEKNPGTLTFIETSDDGHFKYFFMALGPCIRGYRSSIRKVISVDGTFLTARYGGTLLIATCQDANIQIYPLAWAIVDSENSAAWTWFFEKLKEITGDSSDLVIVSDRGTSIPGAFQEVFKLAHHGYCNYHLIRNLKTEFPRLDLDALFWATAEAYYIPQFEINMAALCSMREGINEYLENVGLHRWARSHFKATRYNILTTNNAESLNAVLKTARDFPVLGLVEHIRETLQRWFHERNEQAKKCSSFLTPPLEAKMCTKYNESNGLEVNHVSPNVLQVGRHSTSHVVNLEEHTCTCRVFELDQFPCAHAIAGLRYLNDNGYRFCSPFYTSSSWRQAYFEPIYPLPSETEWKIPEVVMSRTVLPPMSRRSRGRPSTQRKRSAGEPRKARKCSKCSKYGHNRGTCKEDPTQAPNYGGN